MIQDERIEPLNARPERNRRYILYWMQAAQRVRCNHALQMTLRTANERNKPVVVVFGLTSDYPEANLRHYHFMLEGLSEVGTELDRMGIRFVIREGSPDTVAIELSRQADMVFTDAGHLRIQRQWRHTAANRMDCPLIEVETNLIVPVTAAARKDCFSAGVFRPRINRELGRFLVPLSEIKPKHSSMNLKIPSLDLSDMELILRKRKMDRSVEPAPNTSGGTRQALCRLDEFVESKLAGYDEGRNDPTIDFQSHLSPYLHFGQISPLEIAMKILPYPGVGKEAFLEQLIVRRELSSNFIRYNSRYDQYDGLPDWAKRTLAVHARDKRPYRYSGEQLEQALTHDPYWNAAQKEMILTGTMHGYMRMYWGKKILEWSKTPREAFETAMYLNDKYELDGRDPNGFAGVAWCFGKHDRPWVERPIFGKIRYMNDAGLKRKFHVDQYVQNILTIEREWRG